MRYYSNGPRIAPIPVQYNENPSIVLLRKIVILRENNSEVAQMLKNVTNFYMLQIVLALRIWRQEKRQLEHANT